MVRHDQIIKAACVLPPEDFILKKIQRNLLVWVVFVQSYTKICIITFHLNYILINKCCKSQLGSVVEVIILSPSHPSVILLCFISCRLSIAPVIHTADILTPVYFEMSFKRYQLPFWSQLPLRGSADQLVDLK